MFNVCMCYSSPLGVSASSPESLGSASREPVARYLWSDVDATLLIWFERGALLLSFDQRSFE